MTTIDRFMPVPPAAVWAALAIPGATATGSSGQADPRRRPGLAGPRHPLPPHDRLRAVQVEDHTVALESEPLRRLVLRAKGRPALTARVTLDLLAEDGGTRVRMGERPDGVFAPLGLNPLVHLATRWRNTESLMRLEELAMRHAS